MEREMTDAEFVPGVRIGANLVADDAQPAFLYGAEVIPASSPEASPRGVRGRPLPIHRRR